MKGRELIQYILENHLQDFDFGISIVYRDEITRKKIESDFFELDKDEIEISHDFNKVHLKGFDPDDLDL